MFDKVTLKNKLLKKLFLIWNGEDCNNTIRKYIENIDYKNGTIAMSIWMENIDELRIKIIAKNETLYL